MKFKISFLLISLFPMYHNLAHQGFSSSESPGDFLIFGVLAGIVRGKHFFNCGLPQPTAPPLEQNFPPLRS